MSTSSKGQDLTNCWLWKNYSELPKPIGAETVVKHFQWECQANAFQVKFSVAGFTNPSFHPYGFLSPGAPAYDKLEKGLANVDPSCSFGVVFHGTPTKNLAPILYNGLDPSKRKRQVYGPGEYFSTEPGASVSFCYRGLEMLVFVVVAVPPSASTKPGVSIESSARRSPRIIPPDYVIVENNCHQIPIGIMQFDAVDRAVFRTSRIRQVQFLELSHEIATKSHVTKETQLKAQIIQDLIANKADLASERYKKHFNVLFEVSRREISWYVHQKLDKEVVVFYFDDLPEPLSAKEMASTNLQSLGDAKKQEQEANQRFEAAKKQPPNPDDENLEEAKALYQDRIVLNRWQPFDDGTTMAREQDLKQGSEEIKKEHREEHGDSSAAAHLAFRNERYRHEQGGRAAKAARSATTTCVQNQETLNPIGASTGVQHDEHRSDHSSSLRQPDIQP
jgi:hypothetical protein